MHIVVCLTLFLVAMFLISRINTNNYMLREYPPRRESELLRVNPHLSGTRLDVDLIGENSLQFTIINDSEYGILLVLRQLVYYVFNRRSYSPRLEVYENGIWWTIIPTPCPNETLIIFDVLPAHLYIYPSGEYSFKLDRIDWLMPFKDGALHRIVVDAVRVISYQPMCYNWPTCVPPYRMDLLVRADYLYCCHCGYPILEWHPLAPVPGKSWFYVFNIEHHHDHPERHSITGSFIFNAK